MDFALADEQVAIRDMAVAFGRERIAPHALAWEAEGTIPRDVLEEAGALGLAAMYVPEEQGGAGLARLDAVLVFEALAEACPAVSSFISIHNMVAWMLATWGSDAARATHLPGAADLTRIGATA
jgi:alkylation response protein AidB-like acyl-CoA dehydrogenase